MKSSLGFDSDDNVSASESDSESEGASDPESMEAGPKVTGLAQHTEVDLFASG